MLPAITFVFSQKNVNNMRLKLIVLYKKALKYRPLLLTNVKKL